ncbi:SspB family protein [Coralliovum pocilloporae]|uniref:SspB family protein n=1 Tax=Coralliovum pocilloporae TaxID=3066369 RepID=UPI003306FA08
MTTDHIRFDILAQEALRGVVRRVLSEVSKAGLPGEHHFYISFDTRAPGVDISERLHEQYAEDMTIVLQHQFWDLAVHEHHFEIGLSFSGVPEKLVVPFSAIKGFFDPSVQFGLQFDVSMGEEADLEQDELTDTLLKDKPVPLEPLEQDKPVDVTPAAEPLSETITQSEKTEEKESEKPPAGETGGADVVSLDSFRKKPS